MSCNGCRVLRKACAENCILRTCLKWIPTPEAQGNATLFLAKFFGRSDLLALIAAVPESQRTALFRSLLFEACGRTVNPINGAAGLLSEGNWQVCQNAVSTVLGCGTLQPLPVVSTSNESAAQNLRLGRQFYDASPSRFPEKSRGKRSHWPMRTASSTWSETSEMVTFESSGCDRGGDGGGAPEMKLLNLFV